jgi:hypothetical protein
MKIAYRYGNLVLLAADGSAENDQPLYSRQEWLTSTMADIEVRHGVLWYRGNRFGYSSGLRRIRLPQWAGK